MDLCSKEHRPRKKKKRLIDFGLKIRRNDDILIVLIDNEREREWKIKINERIWKQMEKNEEWKKN